MTTRHPDTLIAVKLHMLLSSHMLGREFGHFITQSRGRVHYPGYPNETKDIQRRLDELVARMAIVYLFSVFDDYKTDAMMAVLTPDEKKRLGAYRHVRNCAAHGILFERSPRQDQSYRDFEAVMQSANPLPGIVYHPTELVCAGTGIEFHCRENLERIIGLIIGGLEA